jgi:predicted transcriptional regulator
VDASGIKLLGEGEWKVKVHGKGRPRKWIKLHLAVDAKTQEIVAELTTASSVGDPTAFE